MQPLVLQGGIFEAQTGSSFAEGEPRSLEFSEVIFQGCSGQGMLPASANHVHFIVPFFLWLQQIILCKSLEQYGKKRCWVSTLRSLCHQQMQVLASAGQLLKISCVLYSCFKGH